MTQTASNYGKVLYDLKISKEVVKEAREILTTVPQLWKELLNPTVKKSVKISLIKKIFPKELHSFLCVLCEYQNMDQVFDIFEAYEKEYRNDHAIIQAELEYVTEPDEKQVEQFRTYILERFGQKDGTVELKLTRRPELLGGFVIRVGEKEIDQSLVGKMRELENKLVWR